jgi:hypothetical protein
MQQQQQKLTTQKTNTNTKRKFNNLLITEVELNEDEINCEKSPVKVKINDFNIKLQTSESNFDYEEDIIESEEFVDENMVSTGNINRRTASRELLTFVIPEEAEENSLIEVNKEK